MTTIRTTSRYVALLTVAVLALLLHGGMTYTSAANATAPTAAARVHATKHCARHDLTPYQAIACIWPAPLRADARKVAHCESTAEVSNELAKRRGLGRWAKDYASGTHWGVFQLGARERRDYGPYRIGSDARLQVASAYRLYRARGWQPWKWSRACHGVS